MSFSQLPTVEKDTEKWAAGKFLGPSYFETTLVLSTVNNTFVLYYLCRQFIVIETASFSKFRIVENLVEPKLSHKVEKY